MSAIPANTSLLNISTLISEYATEKDSPLTNQVAQIVKENISEIASSYLFAREMRDQDRFAFVEGLFKRNIFSFKEIDLYLSTPSRLVYNNLKSEPESIRQQKLFEDKVQRFLLRVSLIPFIKFFLIDLAVELEQAGSTIYFSEGDFRDTIGESLRAIPPFGYVLNLLFEKSEGLGIFDTPNGTRELRPLNPDLTALHELLHGFHFAARKIKEIDSIFGPRIDCDKTCALFSNHEEWRTITGFYEEGGVLKQESYHEHAFAAALGEADKRAMHFAVTISRETDPLRHKLFLEALKIGANGTVQKLADETERRHLLKFKHTHLREIYNAKLSHFKQKEKAILLTYLMKKGLASDLVNRIAPWKKTTPWMDTRTTINFMSKWLTEQDLEGALLNAYFDMTQVPVSDISNAFYIRTLEELERIADRPVDIEELAKINNLVKQAYFAAQATLSAVAPEKGEELETLISQTQDGYNNIIAALKPLMHDVTQLSLNLTRTQRLNEIPSIIAHYATPKEENPSKVDIAQLLAKIFDEIFKPHDQTFHS